MERFHSIISVPHAWLVEASELTGVFIVAGAQKRQKQEVARRGEMKTCTKKGARCVVATGASAKGPNTNTDTKISSAYISFIPLHLCPDIVRVFFCALFCLLIIWITV